MRDFEDIPVQQSQAGLRLDEFVHRQDGSMPIAAIRKAIKSGDVLVNGKERSSGWRVRVDDIVSLRLQKHLHRALESEDLELQILFEDAQIIAVNKPPSMLSHPSTKERTGTLINALLHYFKKSTPPGSSPPRPSLVHRLDRETSGVILIAKQDTALSKLSKQFNERRVKKNYQAIVFGRPENSSIKAPIGWHPALWPKWRVMEKDGKPAETVFQIAETTNEFSLLELQPLTGRTHQLRIHLAHIGHPIVGDHTYGRTPNKELELTESQKVTRHLLHAASLTFRHPVSNQEVVLKAALPKDMVEFWNSRKKTR